MIVHGFVGPYKSENPNHYILSLNRANPLEDPRAINPEKHKKGWFAVDAGVTIVGPFPTAKKAKWAEQFTIVEPKNEIQGH